MGNGVEYRSLDATECTSSEGDDSFNKATNGDICICKNKRRVKSMEIWRDQDTYSDREILLKLLSESIPAADAGVAVKFLFDYYGTYADILAAPMSELMRVPSLGARGTKILKSVHDAAIRLATVPLRQEPIISSSQNLLDYLNVSLARERKEQCRVLFLDASHYLLCNYVVSKGDCSFVYISVRDILSRIVEIGAASIVLIHNHPSGDAIPSDDDLLMTRRLATAVELLGAKLLDHLIVGRGIILSLKELGVIK